MRNTGSGQDSRHGIPNRCHGYDLKKMRSVMDRLDKTLREVKHRVWPEPRPIQAEYIEEADKEFEEIEARKT